MRWIGLLMKLRRGEQHVVTNVWSQYTHTLGGRRTHSMRFLKTHLFQESPEEILIALTMNCNKLFGCKYITYEVICNTGGSLDESKYSKHFLKIVKGSLEWRTDTHNTYTVSTPVWVNITRTTTGLAYPVVLDRTPLNKRVVLIREAIRYKNVAKFDKEVHSSKETFILLLSDHTQSDQSHSQTDMERLTRH